MRRGRLGRRAGPVPERDLPASEDLPCRPVEGYGLSKYLATVAALAARPPIEPIVARVFNPIGPGLPRSQAFGRFASLLAEAPGVTSVATDPVILEVGDLEPRRDFIDVRDVARAFVALARSGRPGQVYHVGSGRSERVGDGLDHLIALSGRTVKIVTRPDLGTARGPRDSRANIRRICADTPWRPEIDWRRSLHDLWQDLRPR